MSEQGSALFQLAVLTIICGPFYLAFLAYGIAYRKRLIVDAFMKWLFIFSFPVAFILIGLIHFYGTEAINTSSEVGAGLANAALASLGIGVVAAVVIAAQTIRAKRRK